MKNGLKRFLKYLLIVIFLNFLVIGGVYSWLYFFSFDEEGNQRSCDSFSNLEESFKEEDCNSDESVDLTEGCNIQEDYQEDYQDYEKEVSILNFGDLMLGRLVGQKIKGGLDPFSEFRKHSFAGNVSWDFIVANLEGPISAPRECVQKEYSFRFEPEVASLLQEVGFNVFNLANNHAFDCYKEGLEETKKHLSDVGLLYFGNPVSADFIQKDGLMLIGLDTTVGGEINFLDYEEPIKMAKLNGDFVVVNAHWGEEYQKKSNQEQKDLAYRLIDAGADLIIGHHSHVIQEFEIYKGKPIFYSLGNFVFDQIGIDENTGLGVGAVLRDGVINLNLYPFEIVNHTPIFYQKERAVDFCRQYLVDIKPDQDESISKEDCFLAIQ